MGGQRLDAAMVARGLSRGRDSAKRAIKAGEVSVNGQVVTRPAADISDTDEIVSTGAEDRYVSRGALKLRAGLDAFQIDVSGRVCLDVGASTGGFTQILCEAGAERVFAVDVGRGQLHPDIKADARVIDISPVHAAELTHDMISSPIDVLVCDVSFIGLRKALGAALKFCSPTAALCVLIKPQFELGPEAIGKGGQVQWPVDRIRTWIEAEIVPWFEGKGWRPLGLIDSPITGGDGNHEFLFGAVRDGAA